MESIFKKFGINLTDDNVHQFEALLGQFKEWNNKINLSSIKDDEGIILKHFVDSLLVTKYFNFDNKKVLDLGTGGGFPSLPLGIVTSADITALDSVNKKLKAVQDMADNLNLKVKTVHGRAEELGQNKKWREQFDIVIARAVAPWPILLELALPFVKVDGVFIALQGPKIKDDLRDSTGVEEILGGVVEDVFEDELDDSERVMVQVVKKERTPKDYPRKPGEPKRKPLK